MKYPIDRLIYDGLSAHHYAYMVKVLEEPESTCVKDAVVEEIREAFMDEEMVALDRNHTWELMSLPHDKKASGCKCVYKVKYNVDGSINRYNTRLVAKGYAQTFDIDYRKPSLYKKVW